MAAEVRVDGAAVFVVVVMVVRMGVHQRRRQHECLHQHAKRRRDEAALPNQWRVGGDHVRILCEAGDPRF
jgi:hypothetical protein